MQRISEVLVSVSHYDPMQRIRFVIVMPVFQAMARLSRSWVFLPLLRDITTSVECSGRSAGHLRKCGALRVLRISASTLKWNLGATSLTDVYS